MSYAQRFLRLVMSGSLYTTEQFSYGLNLISAGGAPPGTGGWVGPAIDEVPEAVVTAVSSFHAASGVSHNAAVLRTIKLNMIGVDGRYESQTATVLHDLDPPVQGYSTTAWPPQCAIVVSLGTALRRGPASRGRFYVPYSTQNVGNLGVIGEPEATGVVVAGRQLVNGLNTAIEGWRVGCVSNVGMGAQTVVDKVRVGRVVDTVRSRRNALPEDYVSMDVDSGAF